MWPGNLGGWLESGLGILGRRGELPRAVEGSVVGMPCGVWAGRGRRGKQWMEQWEKSGDVGHAGGSGD